MRTPCIEKMTWAEFQSVMEGADTVIVPVGVMEEHGLHNPLGTDILIAEHIAAIVGETTGIPVTPSLPHGYAADVTGFAGSTSLEPETYRKLLLAHCEPYLSLGIRRFVMVSGHSGNTMALEMLAADLYDQYGALCVSTDWWTVLPQLDPALHCQDHGSYFETSMMLAARDDLVDMSAARDVPLFALTEKLQRKYYWKFQGADVGIVCDMKQVNPYGNIGSPNRDGGSTKALGEKMTGMYIRFLCDLIAEIRRIPLQPRKS